MKKIFIISVSIMMLFLCSCSLEYSYSNGKTADSVYYVFNSSSEICFAAEYTWDESEKDIIIDIPDTVDGYEVTTLGGFTGRGVPTPFCIVAQDDESSADLTVSDGDIENINVTIRLGKNVKEIKCCTMNNILNTDKGRYRFVSEFEIDEENEYFEADENGRLIYSKYSPKFIDSFNYAED